MKKIIGMLLIIVVLLAAAGSVSAQIHVGDIVTFGHYEQDNNLRNGAEPIEWQVLAVESDRALVISRYGLDAKPYNEKLVDITWENCTLRAWLNGEFYNSAFSSAEQSRIRQVTNKNPDNPNRGIAGGNDTQDRIFLLSNDEAWTYFASDDARKCYATDYAKANGAWINNDYGTIHWWLRSPVGVAENVFSSGVVGYSGNRVNIADAVARPAFWLDLNGVASSSDNTAAAGTPASSGSAARVGDIITFGHYEQDNNRSNGAEAIEWQVLAVESGRALVISRYALDAKEYHEGFSSITWENCTLRAWLNGEFYSSAFSAAEQSRIRQVTNKNRENSEYGTAGGNDTQDRIFLLSIDEAQMYFSGNNDGKCYATAYAKAKGAYVDNSSGTSPWWLRSPGYSSNSAAYFSYIGEVNTHGNIVPAPTCVIRPAFWLDL